MTNVPKHETALDSDEQQLGALYAKALLGAVGPNVDAIVSELESLVKECLNENPSLERALASPRISQEQKEGMLDRIFSGRIDKNLLNFLKILCRRGRIGSLRAIQVTASVLREEQLGRMRVIVTTAQALTSEQKTQIASQLSKTYGKEAVLVERVDESLLGGIVIRIGDRVLDGSVLGKMATLRSAVAAGVQKAIRDRFDSLLSS